MRDMARKKSNKTSFDIAYIQSIDFYKNLGKRAMSVMEDSKYLDLCGTTELEKSFCHHDYTYHNIIIDGDENVNVIDFDYYKKEVRIYDISAFMIKVLKRTEWNMEYVNLIIEAYKEVTPLLDDEYRVLFGFLLFPQRFWRLSNRFYYNEVNWAQTTFGNKINDLILEQDNYLKFIDDFKQAYNQKE